MCLTVCEYVCVCLVHISRNIWTESLFICVSCASIQVEIVGLWCVILPKKIKNTLAKMCVCVHVHVCICEKN